MKSTAGSGKRSRGVAPYPPQRQRQSQQHVQHQHPRGCNPMVIVVAFMTMIALFCIQRLFGREETPESVGIGLPIPVQPELSAGKVTSSPPRIHSTLPVDSISASADTPPHSGSTMVNSQTSSTPGALQMSSVFDSKILCAANVSAAYSSAEMTTQMTQDLRWCKEMLDKNKIIIGRSWGGLIAEKRLIWDKKKCNELLLLGRLQSCEDRWGWKMMTDWQNDVQNIVKGMSIMSCAKNLKTSVLCKYRYVVLDFKQMVTNGPAKGKGGRVFNPGFIRVFNGMDEVPYHDPNYLPPWSSLQYVKFNNKNVKHRQLLNTDEAQFVALHSTDEITQSEMAQKRYLKAAPDIPTVPEVHPRLQTLAQSKCDMIESRPTFVTSNDDVYNLGHYFNDVAGIWGLLTMAGVDSKSAVLLSIDAFRLKNRPINMTHPDYDGPFGDYFNSWFHEVKHPADYKNKRVCFQELYLPAKPGIPWVWNDWGIENGCSTLASSPLYQSFNLFLRQRWNERFGPLPNPPLDSVHIVIEIRAIDPKKGVRSSSRFIRNLEELLTALQGIGKHVKITAQNFAEISFHEQVALAHSASIFISMHGAGTPHIFNTAVGQPNCCAVIEMFPDTKTVDFYQMHGYANIARNLGLHSYRYIAADGSSSEKGTTLEVSIVKEMVVDAIEKVTHRPTCLHNVRDTLGGKALPPSPFTSS